ncbi:hypothetical protein HY418_01585 [Candidatus Kaiserbacteria bacterium]|nr:hypothetical protein [Candidatus Kaiserbacteria bacterium]
MDKILLLIHPTTGALAIISTVWVFVEALNASARNRVRLWWASCIGAFFMVATAVAGGYWYITYYAVDKAAILAGPWPIAHTLVMETKEHIFFITLILSLLLPLIIAREDLVANRGARILVLVVSALVVLSAFAIEGAGAFISMAARISL